MGELEFIELWTEFFGNAITPLSNVTVIAFLQHQRESYEEVDKDHKRLVRMIDVILNGEEGAAKQASLCDVVGQIRELKQRAEFTEQKLLETQEQEPYCWRAIGGSIWDHKTCDDDVPLYAAPIPPADVANEIVRWKEAAADLGRCFDSSNKRISELERKLAEQTTFADKYAHEVIELTRKHEKRGIIIQQYLEELSHLRADIEEAKRQAVPEGWIDATRDAVESISLVLCAGGDYGDELTDCGLRKRLSTAQSNLLHQLGFDGKDAMYQYRQSLLSASHQPPATPEERKE